MLLLILACHGDPLVDSGTSGGEDGGAVDEGAVDGGVEEAVPCSALMPFDQTGTTWSYLGEPVTEQALTRAVVGPGDYRGEAAWQVDEHQEGWSDDSWMTWERSLWVRCDADGVWLLGGAEAFTDRMHGASSHSDITTLHYTSPAWLVPGEVTLGTTWTSDWSYDWERDDGDSGTRSGTVQHEVVAFGEVTVPAGTWEAWQVQRTGGAPLALVEGVGAVVDGDFELVEVEP